MTIRVMLVDDSTIVRELMKRALTVDKDIEVIATAFNGAVAVMLAKQHQPDVIILDIEMPEMDGLTALPKLLEVAPGTKIIMASTLTMRNANIGLQALGLGASDYIAKPSARDPRELETFYREVLEKIRALAGAGKKAAATSAVKPVLAAPPVKPVKLAPASVPLSPAVKALAIASSTGGPQALQELFAGLKDHLKHIPIFITQHMPPTFTTVLAGHISKAASRTCSESKEGETVVPGQIYIAPGNFHMLAKKSAESVTLHINQEPQENFCRPAADPMLRSLSSVYGAGLLTLVLTGMGSDGLEGSKIVIKNGGHVIAQDEASSAVWGMPRAVAENGLCMAVLPLNQIASYILKAVSYARG